MDKQYAIDLQTLTKTVDSFAESFGDYLETELEYFDYLRKRPRFFLGKKYVRNRIVIGKLPVPEKETKNTGSLFPPRRRNRVRVPVAAPLKVKQLEAEESIKEPVREPANIPVTSGKDQKQKDREITKSLEELTKDLPSPEIPKVVPTKPLIPSIPKPVKAPQVVPANYGPLIAEARQRAISENRSQSVSMPDGGRVFIDRRGTVESVKTGAEVKEGEKQSEFWKNVFLFSNTPFFLGGRRTPVSRTVPGMAQTTGLKGPLTPPSPAAPQAANSIVRFIRSLVPSRNAEGGVPQGPSRALIGERASPKGNELVATASQLPGITEAIHKEIGSIMIGATFSVAYAIPHGRSSSAILNDINQLKRTFGMDRISQPTGIGRAAGSMEVFNIEGFQQKLIASSKEIKRRPGSRGGQVGERNAQEDQQPVQLSPIEILGDVKVDATGEPGYDFTPKGGKNLAIFPGKVIEWNYQYNPNKVGGDKIQGSGYGNYVVIRSSHPQYPNEQFDALYAHFPNSEVNKYVRVGDTVQRGQVLGLMGTKAHPRNQVGSLTGPHTSLDFLEPGTNTPYRRWRSLEHMIKGGPNTGQPPRGQGGSGFAEFVQYGNLWWQEQFLNSGLVPVGERDNLRKYWAEEAEKDPNYNFPMMLSRFLLSTTDELRFKTDLMFKGLGEGVEFSADFTGSGPSNPKTWAGRIFKGRKIADFLDQKISKLFFDKWKPDIFKKLAGANYAGQYFTPDLMTSIKYAGKNGTVIVLPRAQGVRGLKNFLGSRISRGFDPSKGIEQFVRTKDVQRITSQAAAIGQKYIYDLSKAADVAALKKLAQISSKTSPILAKFGRAIPFLGIAAAVYDVQDRVRKGDWAGAAFGAISAIPGPLGWVGLGLQVAYDVGKTQKSVYKPGGGRQRGNLRRSSLNRSVVVPVPVQGPSKTVPVPVRRRNVRGGGSIVISPFGKGSTKK